MTFQMGGGAVQGAEAALRGWARRGWRVGVLVLALLACSLAVGMGSARAGGAVAPCLAIEDGVVTDGTACSGPVTIPAGVTTIGDFAFLGSPEVTSIAIPASVTHIEAGAFGLSPKLTSISVDAGNPEFFADADGVLYHRVYDPGHVNVVGTVLTQYPNGRTGPYEIPRGVTTIGDGAFLGASGLTGFSVEAGSSDFSADAAGVLFNTGKTALIQYPDGREASPGQLATGYTIPASVTGIQDGAFVLASGLTGIAVDPANREFTSGTDGVVYTKDGATLVQYPGGRTASAYAIPREVTLILQYAFTGAAHLERFSVDAGNTVFSTDADGVLFVDYLGTKILYQYPVGAAASGYALPSDVGFIYSLAFYGARNLESTTIPGGVQVIGLAAFFGATNLASVYFEGAAAPTTFGMSAFTNVKAGATAYRFTGAAGFVPTGTPPRWSGLLVADYVDALAQPPAPTATLQGNGTSAQVTVTAASIGPTATSYLVTASPGGATCEVTGASGSCLVSGLASGVPHTFTAIARAASFVSGPSSPSSTLTCLDIRATVVEGIGSCAGAVVIPSAVTGIGERAFEDVTGLTSVAFEAPSRLTTIGDGAFFDAANLTSIVLPAGLTTIGAGAFFGTSSLAVITIPDRVTSIGTAAFVRASSLTAIAIPRNVTTIGESAFALAAGLQGIVVDPANPAYSSDADGALLDKGGTTLIQYPIGREASRYTIPGSVTRIEDYAFAQAPHLEGIVVPRSVTDIGEIAFAGMPALAAFTVDPASTAFSSDAVGVLFDKGGSTLIQYPVGAAATGYEVPAGVEAIGVGAFLQTTLSSVSFASPSVVSSIGNGAFASASRLEDIEIPRSVESIGESAFDSATRLKHVTFEAPSRLTDFGHYAFSDATSLESIEIPAGVESIDFYVFKGATSLARLYFQGAVAPAVDAGAFADAATGATAYRLPGATGFATAGTPPRWNGLVVAEYLPTPPAPTAVAGVESAAIDVASPLVVPAPSSYVVAASPGGAQCTVSGASGSCSIAGLTAGTAYTFTAVMRTANPEVASLPSPASAPVVPTAPPAVPAASPAAQARLFSPVGAPRQTSAGLVVTIAATTPGTVGIQVTAVAARALRTAPRVLCSTRQRVRQAGRITLMCRYTKAARKLLARESVRALQSTRFKPVGGTAVTTTSMLTLKRLSTTAPSRVTG